MHLRDFFRRRRRLTIDRSPQLDVNYQATQRPTHLLSISAPKVMEISKHSDSLFRADSSVIQACVQPSGDNTILISHITCTALVYLRNSFFPYNI